MINRNGVHLPDTTYGGNPINWNCSSDSDDSLQRLKTENAKLRTLARTLYYCGQCDKNCDQCAMNGADMRVRLSETEYCDGINALMRELGLVD